MVKVIWKKDDLERIKQDLHQTYHIELTLATEDLPEDQVALVVDEKDLDKLYLVLNHIKHEQSKLMLPTHDGWIQIYVDDVTFLESYGDDIYLHQYQKPTQMIKQPLYQLETTLKPHGFVRISKSYIVNISKIVYIRTGFNAKLDLELSTGDHLEVSRSYVKDFKQSLGIA